MCTRWPPSAVGEGCGERRRRAAVEEGRSARGGGFARGARVGRVVDVTSQLQPFSCPAPAETGRGPSFEPLIIRLGTDASELALDGGQLREARTDVPRCAATQVTLRMLDSWPRKDQAMFDALG